MYTGIFIKVKLKPSTPPEVLEDLNRMTLNVDFQENWSSYQPKSGVDHPLFACPSWRSVLCCQSAYLAECEKLQPEPGKRVEVSQDGSVTLHASASLKNYHGEIEHFLDWLAPRVDPSEYGRVCGWVRYEETRAKTVFAFEYGKVSYSLEPSACLACRGYGEYGYYTCSECDGTGFTKT